MTPKAKTDEDQELTEAEEQSLTRFVDTGEDDEMFDFSKIEPPPEATEEP